jgi:Tfp pilus assembly protein PilN
VLLAKQEELNMNLAQKKRLVEELERLGQFKEQRFSDLFNALSEIDSPSIWLTDIHINELNLKIDGRLSTPDALPTWLRQLSTKPYFSQRSFRHTQVKNDEQGLMFTISTLSPNQISRELPNG